MHKRIVNIEQFKYFIRDNVQTTYVIQMRNLPVVTSYITAIHVIANNMNI